MPLKIEIKIVKNSKRAVDDGKMENARASSVALFLFSSFPARFLVFFSFPQPPHDTKRLSGAESVQFLESLLQLDDLLDSRDHWQTAHAESFT